MRWDETRLDKYIYICELRQEELRWVQMRWFKWKETRWNVKRDVRGVSCQDILSAKHRVPIFLPTAYSLFGGYRPFRFETSTSGLPRYYLYLRGQWHCFAAFAAALPVVIASVQWAICDNVRAIEWKPLMKHLAGLLVDHTLGGSIMYCGWSCCEGIDGFRGGRRGPASRFCRRAVWVLPRAHMVNWQHGRVNGHYHHHRMS